MGRQIRILRIPKSVKEIIKGTDAGSITEFKTAEDRIKRIDLQLGSLVCQRMGFEINRQQIRALHTGRGSGLRAKDRVSRTQKFIGIRKIKIPEMFDDIPGSPWRRHQDPDNIYEGL